MIKINSAEFIAGIEDLKQHPKLILPEVAFAGRSNVGKSSLINCLLNRKGVARTSNTPGKTQQLNYYKINGKFYFVDLPGYGFAKVSQQERAKWKELIEAYLQTNTRLKGIVQLIDLRLKPQELDLEMSEWLNFLGKTFWVVATKADKLSRNEQLKQDQMLRPVYQKFNPAGFLIFSAQTSQGREELWKGIDNVLLQA